MSLIAVGTHTHTIEGLKALVSSLTSQGVQQSVFRDGFPPSIDTAVPSISDGNGTECSPIRSLIIRVITKSDDRAAGVRFVYHEYDYRPNWTT